MVIPTAVVAFVTTVDGVHAQMAESSLVQVPAQEPAEPFCERVEAPVTRTAFDRYDRYGNCSICSIDPIDSIFEKVRKIQNATFEGIKPIVPGFFRIGFRFERIPGRSA